MALAMPASSIQFRGTQSTKMRARFLRQQPFRPWLSAKLIEALVLCKDEPQASIQGIVSK
jgi:hypothetical protein